MERARHSCRTMTAYLPGGIEKTLPDDPTEYGLRTFKDIITDTNLMETTKGGLELTLETNLHENQITSSSLTVDISDEDGLYVIVLKSVVAGLESESTFKTRILEGLHDYIRSNVIIWSTAHHKSAVEMLKPINEKLRHEYEESLKNK